ncbi:MAG: ribosome assembly factor SBDS [Candidatus Caldarchaeum sp.]|uniref:Ribosome assembly factor SBDS n=1 Tax=Caldiarchaeum subterraneum TaxID=311458 RepID=A0A7C4E0T2_CALS0|nr:ribosome assembly factor SBDS [Candidatus Caldarchaeales archaeon]
MPKQRENYTIARLGIGGTTYEVLVDPENALRYKMGEKIPITKILAYEEVFKDWKKGVRASESELKKNFGTTDVRVVAERIMAEGEVLITTEQRRRLIDEKKRQIIDFIARNAIDPRTNTPHPPQRIELALEQVGLSVEPFADPKVEALKAVEKLRRVLPIKIGNMKVEIRVAGEFMGKVYGLIRSMGTILEEGWLGDGSWRCVAEIPTGVQADLIERLNKICGGRVEVKPVG